MKQPKLFAKSSGHFEIPQAVRHDAQTLAEDAKTLIRATLDVADAKVIAARERLESALDSSMNVVDRVQTKTIEGVRMTDECVRNHPYETVALAFGIGAMLSCLLLWRRI